MRSVRAWLLALTVTTTAAGAVAYDLPAARASCGTPNMNDVTFKIRRGRHRARPNGFRRWKLKRRFSRSLAFRVRFEDSVKYATSDPRNQLDWNKLMGISTVFIHKNSVRLGWRWNPTTRLVDLGFYGYLGRARTFKRLASVAPGEWADVRLTMDTASMSVTVDGARHEERGDMDLPGWLPVSTVVLRTAYFGGDETAPHGTHIEVRDVAADRPCD